MAGSLTGCVCCAGVDIIFANTVTQLPQGRPILFYALAIIMSAGPWDKIASTS